MTYHFEKWALIVNVSETVDGKFEVSVVDPDTHPRRLAAKQFKRGTDPSSWVAAQMTKRLPKWIADYHRHRNDDWRREETEDPPIREDDGDRYFDTYCDDWLRYR